MDSKIKIMLLINKIADRTDALGIKMLMEVLNELQKLEVKDSCKRSKKI